MGGGPLGGRGGSDVVMFTPTAPNRTNYLELSFADPYTSMSAMREILTGHDGIAMLVLQPTDAGALYDERQREGLELLPLIRIQFPAEGTIPAMNAEVIIPVPRTQPLLTNAARVWPLEALGDPALARHPNTARRWSRVTAVASDSAFDATVEFHATRLFGIRAQRTGTGVATLCPGTVELRWMSESAFRAQHPAMELPPGSRLPCAVAVTIEVEDLAGVRRHLQANAVPHRGESAAVIVRARDGAGLNFEFVER